MLQATQKIGLTRPQDFAGKAGMGEINQAREIQEKTATEFETAFIAQMLQFSGLAKALTVGGGAAVESFTQFYLEELAKDISNNGGFGIAEKISAYMEMKEDTHGELGRL